MFITDDAIEARCTWVTAMQASELLKPHYPNERAAQTRIIKRSGANMLASKCDRIEGGPSAGTSHYTQDNCLISPQFWSTFDVNFYCIADWVAGDFDLQNVTP